MSVVIGEEPIDTLHHQAELSIAFTVDRVMHVDGTTLEEVAVAEPWVKDYDAIGGNHPRDWATRFDVSSWVFLVARDDEGMRVGGLVLDGPVVWDLRVATDRRGQGVGARLWRAAEARGATHLEVETQNVNVPACRFYARMGCALAAVDPLAYPDLPGEIALHWRKELTPPSR